ncbi:MULTISPECIES: S24 family peptidase [unclassified Halomonas]|uniref:LexA family protein n=1 Tax=unclassified Halomonas TaxID=2609666 RepID=UPI0028851549|nr:MULTISPECIES: S24 family peptidase [unclassified Halomonas]MDT0501625.1 S24 family peptidase [Halomonas sp. PAR7]MDT0511018.1 S24 family peptidase [Halomonas sp. LES1]MDT0592465.1 S24 family peptidase [Halomonas sp. PAR8]
MRVNYLGPACLGIDHPALEGYDLSRFRPSCYLVEVSEDAGVGGPLMEGDLLVVDEQKPAQHDDLVVVELDGEQRLFSSHRIGGRMRLIPTAGPKESIWARHSDLRGVVVRKARITAA